MNHDNIIYKIIIAFLIVVVTALSIGIGLASLIGVYKLILWLLSL